MSAKSIDVRRNPIDPWVALPGSTGELNLDQATVDDSISGSNFTSMQPTLITWGVNANGYFKGFPGYQATLKRAGTPVSMTDEPTASSNGGFYIVDRDRSVLDRNTPVVVNDAGFPVDEADIEFIDYLQGGVVFVDSYTPNGAITITGSFRPTSPICFAQTFNLGLTADTENVTDFCTAQNNNGFAIFRYQRQTVELTLDGFYSPTSNYNADLIGRTEVIIEVNPDGQGLSVARGYFKATSVAQSGDVGNTETQSATYMLFVPEGVSRPFSWYHSPVTSIPEGIKIVLDAWEDRAEIELRYTPENGLTSTGAALVADTSLESGVEDINTFTFNFQGTDELITA